MKRIFLLTCVASLFCSFVCLRPSRRFRCLLLALVLLGMTALQGCGNSSTDSSTSFSPQTADTSQQDAYETAMQAYIWGYPLVFNYNHVVNFYPITQPIIKNDTVPMAPINQICYLSTLVTTAEHGMPFPNRDCIYGNAWLDLSKDAVVIRIPDMGSRFWIFQMMDMYMDVFASPGSRRNSLAGSYLVVGPGWHGTVPTGIVEVIHAPTHQCVILSRIGCNGNDDLPNVLPLTNSITVCPLSQVNTFPTYIDWAQVTHINTDQQGPPDYAPDDTFWATLRTVLPQTEVQPGEEQMVANFESLLNSPDPAAQAALAAALPVAKKLVAHKGNLATFGVPAGNEGWYILREGGNFGTDYLMRAGSAYDSPYYNLLEDAAYFTVYYSSDGKALDGSLNYRIHFNKEQIPPLGSTGFWSMTLYGADQGLVPNALDQCNLGTYTPQLQYNSDGSVDIYMQNSPPSGHESNWLPTPATGIFSLILRAYVPGTSVVDGTYAPPPITH
jgi:hypothetical protein